jgi:hypothetical protein
MANCRWQIIEEEQEKEEEEDWDGSWQVTAGNEPGAGRLGDIGLST